MDGKGVLGLGFVGPEEGDETCFGAEEAGVGNVVDDLPAFLEACEVDVAGAGNPFEVEVRGVLVVPVHDPPFPYDFIEK